jgi:uncharacterized protein
MRLLKLLLILFVCAAEPTAAKPVDDALAAQRSGDYAKSFYMLLKLASDGDAEAQYFLGHMYRAPLFVPQDYVAAMAWYRKAADQRNAEAQHMIGLLYDEGLGVPQDYGHAVRWYRRSANQGSWRGQFGLGHMYNFGRGVTQDHVQAYMWLTLVVAVEPMYRLDLNYIAAKMTPAQIAEAQKLAREWKPK